MHAHAELRSTQPFLPQLVPRCSCGKELREPRPAHATWVALGEVKCSYACYEAAYELDDAIRQEKQLQAERAANLELPL